MFALCRHRPRDVAVQPVAEESTGAAGLRGEITSFASLVSTPFGITAGPDGALCRRRMPG